jgi:hypothetical protein
MKVIERKKIHPILFLCSFHRWIEDKHKDIKSDVELNHWNKSYDHVNLLENDILAIIEGSDDSLINDNNCFSISCYFNMDFFRDYPFSFALHLDCGVKSLSFAKITTYTISSSVSSLEVTSLQSEIKLPSNDFNSEIDKKIDFEFKDLIQNLKLEEVYYYDERLFVEFLSELKRGFINSLRIMISDLAFE